MATRATYTIKNNRGISTDLYIHWDGYPEGAAAYFYAALTNASASRANGGFAEQIIRAVPGAEITDGYLRHSDTEFHYEINADMTLVASKFERAADGARKLAPIYVGGLHSFINANTDCIENFQPFKPVASKYGRTRWLNATMAKNEQEGPYGDLHHLRIWNQSGGSTRGSGNWQACADNLRAVIDAFPELITDEIKELLA